MRAPSFKSSRPLSQRKGTCSFCTWRYLVGNTQSRPKRGHIHRAGRGRDAWHRTSGKGQKVVYPRYDSIHSVHLDSWTNTHNRATAKWSDAWRCSAADFTNRCGNERSLNLNSCPVVSPSEQATICSFLKRQTRFANSCHNTFSPACSIQSPYHTWGEKRWNSHHLRQ